MMDNGIAVVTGSSGGIGGAVARRLAGMGFKLVLHCHSHMDAAEALCRELAGTGAQARVFQADLSSFSQAEALIEYAVREFGRIDCLVNNAGVTRDGLVMAMSEEDFGRVIDVNLKSCFNCIRHASRHMLRARTGSIVSIASVIGITGNAGQANYAASKAGIIGLTKSCAREFARRGVRVNAVAPGFIETEMTRVLDDRVRRDILERIALGRFGVPGDVADAVGFLCSAQASYITGQVLVVDGGMVI